MLFAYSFGPVRPQSAQDSAAPSGNLATVGKIQKRDQESAKPTAEDAWDDQFDADVARLATAISRMHRNRVAALEPSVPVLPMIHNAEPSPQAPGLMTALSMALAVGALGVLIRSQPARRDRLGSAEAMKDARSALVRCLAVLVVLDLFDLACTLWASGAGGFLEVNPVAGTLIQSPLLVAAIKLAFVAAAVIVLMRFWQFRAAQLASWWGAAVYTVLAIRWAAYSSLFLY